LPPSVDNLLIFSYPPPYLLVVISCFFLSLCLSQYGGIVALFYSILFDVFGALNYKAAFQIVVFGLGAAVGIGGVSAAASFSESSHKSSTDTSATSTAADVTVSDTNSDTGALATNWFYAMSGLTAIGLLLLHILRPINFNKILEKRMKAAEQRQQLPISKIVR
jgi:hypothetical protein